MSEEDNHARAIFKDLMRQVHVALNDGNVPIIKIVLQLENGQSLLFTRGNDYRPPEDIAKEKAEKEKAE